MKNQRKRASNPKIRTDGYAKDIVYSLEIDRIRANTAQPRQDFEIESIIKLADSIRRYGILQPLSVRRVNPEREHGTSHRKKNLVADILLASQEDPLMGTKVGAEAQNHFTQDVSRETCAKIEDNAETSATSETLACALDGVYVSRETRETDEKQLCMPENVLFDAGQANINPVFSSEDPFRNNYDCKNTATAVFLPRDTCQYELVAGERRLRAAKMLGMSRVPCIIVDVSDAISAELALVENMLRENLNMFEQAAAFSHLSNKYSLTQEEIASKMSISQSAVANKMRLLRLTDHERHLIMDADLTERHARAFLRIPDAVAREACIQHVVDHKLNVAETDKYITAVLAGKSQPSNAKREVASQSPEKLCSNIYKFINRIQGASGGYLTVNRKSDAENVIITLTVKKGS